jgi:hypothetical protein
MPKTATARRTRAIIIPRKRDFVVAGKLRQGRATEVYRPATIRVKRSFHIGDRSIGADAHRCLQGDYVLRAVANDGIADAGVADGIDDRYP